jgi:hypothetical protein
MKPLKCDHTKRLRVELLRSKFKSSTRKLSSVSTENGLGLKVDIGDQALGRQKMNWVLTLKFDIEDRALGQQKMNWVLRSTLRIEL